MSRIERSIEIAARRDAVWSTIADLESVAAWNPNVEKATCGTTVTAIADYHVAFGPLGAVVDRLTMKRLMGRMLDRSLAGLKDHIETTSARGSIWERNHDERKRNAMRTQ